jgi:hypothetical protein
MVALCVPLWRKSLNPPSAALTSQKIPSGTKPSPTLSRFLMCHNTIESGKAEDTLMSQHHTRNQTQFIS